VSQRPVHIVCGPTGAGKTTAALALAEHLKAVRFSIDEWMAVLFWKDSPAPVEYLWTVERINRCEALIWSMAKQVLARGLPVVLDLGFTRAQHRSRFVALAHDAGYRCVLHVAEAPAEERWRRVQARNAKKGATYQLQVTREMFEFMEKMWEPPSADELKAD
jgi:predicted kinase